MEVNCEHTSSLRLLLLLLLLSLIYKQKKNILGMKIFSHIVSKSTGPWMTENLHQNPLNQKRRPVTLFSTELSFQAGKLWPLCEKRLENTLTQTNFGPIYTFYQKSSVRILNTKVLHIYFLFLIHLLDQTKLHKRSEHLINMNTYLKLFDLWYKLYQLYLVKNNI